jgi:hypothetical protein
MDKESATRSRGVGEDGASGTLASQTELATFQLSTNAVDFRKTSIATDTLHEIIPDC